MCVYCIISSIIIIIVKKKVRERESDRARKKILILALGADEYRVFGRSYFVQKITIMKSEKHKVNMEQPSCV